jgi:3-oxoadipate enol-lactonase
MNESPAAISFKRTDLALPSGRVSVHIAGAGQPLILLHSLLADRTSFDRVAGPLARTHQLLAFDLPGFADSHFVEGGLDAVADRIAESIAALELRRKPILLGNGYGGFVALMTAIRHPDIAQRMVLADCGAIFSEPGRAAFLGMADAAQKGGLAAVAEIAMRRLFALEYQAQHPELIAQRKERFVALDPRTFRTACLNLAALDLRGHLATMKMPTLVLVGEVDEATPPPMSHELAAALPDARLKVLPGCAHVPQLQAPDMFIDAIRDFIRGD